jgi:hypothetical protein
MLTYENFDPDVKTYITKHLLTSKGNCVKCTPERKRFHDINRTPRFWQFRWLKDLATSCQRTVQAIFDPNRSRCFLYTSPPNPPTQFLL